MTLSSCASPPPTGRHHPPAGGRVASSSTWGTRRGAAVTRILVQTGPVPASPGSRPPTLLTTLPIDKYPETLACLANQGVDTLDGEYAPAKAGEDGRLITGARAHLQHTGAGPHSGAWRSSAPRSAAGKWSVHDRSATPHLRMHGVPAPLPGKCGAASPQSHPEPPDALYLLLLQVRHQTLPGPPRGHTNTHQVRVVHVPFAPMHSGWCGERRTSVPGPQRPGTRHPA